MEYYNTFSLKFEKAIKPQEVKNLIADTLNSKNYDAMYARKPSERLVADLVITDTSISLDGSDGYYIPDDMLYVMEDVLVGIAKAYQEIPFICEMNSDSTYSECEFDAEYNSGTLVIDSALFPYGYCETLHCCECDAEVITVEDCETGKTYICPECGEELNFDDELPEHIHKVIEIS